MSVPPLGARIRTLRLERRLSLRALARVVGVSASLVSQIETGKSQPSVSTLYAITQALGISIEDVFEAEETEATEQSEAAEATEQSEAAAVPESAGQGATAAMAEPLGPRVPAAPSVSASPSAVSGVPGVPGVSGVVAEALLPTPTPGHTAGPLVRPAEREVLRLESGVTWERLGHVPGTHVDFLLVTYAPGGSSSGTGQLMRHTGVEHGYLVEGELTLTLGFDEHLLRPGDAVSFPSGIPHRYRNESDGPAVGVWFVYANDALWPGPSAAT